MKALLRHQYSQGKGVIIFLSIIFCIFSIAIILTLFNHSLLNVAQDQLTAIRENDLQKAYAMTTTSFQEHTPFKTYKEYIDSYPVLRRNKDANFDEIEVDKEFGYLKGVAEAKDGSKMIIEFQLAKENRRWKIQAIRLSSFDE